MSISLHKPGAKMIGITQTNSQNNVHQRRTDNACFQ